MLLQQFIHNIRILMKKHCYLMYVMCTVCVNVMSLLFSPVSTCCFVQNVLIPCNNTTNLSVVKQSVIAQVNDKYHYIQLENATVKFVKFITFLVFVLLFLMSMSQFMWFYHSLASSHYFSAIWNSYFHFHFHTFGIFLKRIFATCDCILVNAWTSQVYMRIKRYIQRHEFHLGEI